MDIAAWLILGVLFVLFFVILYVLLSRIEKGPRAILAASGALLLAPAIYSGSIWLIIGSASHRPSRPDDRPFVASEWRMGDEQCKRSMVNDLVGSKILIGKKQKQVEELLGPVEAPGNSTDSTNLYYGVWNFFGTDIDPVASGWLKLELDSLGKVRNVSYTEWDQGNE